MGKILTKYVSAHDADIELMLDFENAKPDSPEETRIYNEVNDVLQKCAGILKAFRVYEGCPSQIRLAINEPNEEHERDAWESVIPFVITQKEWYEFSSEISDVVTQILSTLCLGEPKQTLVSQQALSKQLADVFDFILTFDDLKMTCPQLQNDFSFYRRTSGKAKQMDLELPIPVEMANMMSLFFAYPTPMMKKISDSSQKYLDSISTEENEKVTTALALMSNICCNMVVLKSFEKEETYLFSLRCMTGAIILFDHIDKKGAFSKSSPINMKKCITALKAQEPVPEGLLNAIRFTTIHINDPDTPSAIHQLLNAK